MATHLDYFPPLSLSKEALLIVHEAEDELARPPNSSYL